MTYRISPRLKRFTEFNEDMLSAEQKAYLDDNPDLEVADYDHEHTIILVPPDWNDPATPSPAPIRVSLAGEIIDA